MTVSIILARGGSKGLPNKNIRLFCGKPLLAWSILQAIPPVYVSSDSREILNVAQIFGAIPIERPPELATDIATSESALNHALDVIGAVDTVIFLPPTSPLRLPHDVPRALELFQSSSADSLFSCVELDDFCAWTEKNGELRGLTYDPANRGRRQDRKPVILENGSIYIFKPEILRRNNNRLGGKIARYVMDPWQQHEIDDQDTFGLCRYYFDSKGLAA